VLSEGSIWRRITDLAKRGCVFVFMEDTDNLTAQRIWRVRYCDSADLLHEAECKTSLTHGTFWKDDRLVS
jgi:hypothetical protein